MAVRSSSGVVASVIESPTASTATRLAIVIVAYNGTALLRACLASLREAGPQNAMVEVHVVDNASEDGAADIVADEFPEVCLRCLTENRGFSAANNLVLQTVDAPYYLLLNPDTEARPGTLDHLLALMEADRSIGLCGCRLVRPDGSFDHAAKRSFPTLASALAHFTGLGRWAGAPPQLAQYRSPDVAEHGSGDVDAINGAFMLVRREALKQVGLLDEGYWLYMEDLDWCHRFHDSGWRVFYDGTVEFMHVKGGSSGSRRRLRQNVAFHRGMGRFYRKFQAGRRPMVDIAIYAGIGAKLSVSVVRNAAATGVSSLTHSGRASARSNSPPRG